MNVKSKRLLRYHLQEQVQLFLMLIQDCLLLNKINIPLSKGLEMKNYREDILNNFIERYEKSSYYKGKSLKPQKSSIVLHERYPQYGQSRYPEVLEKIEDVVLQLEKEDLIQFAKGSIEGNRKLIFVPTEERVSKIYQELDRTPLKEKRNRYLNCLKMYELDSFFKDFQIAMEEKVFNYESVLPYLKVYDQEDLKNVMKILQGMKNQEEEISFRKFSEKVLGDTKKLEKYKNKIYHIIKDFYDDSIENIDDAFELFYIRKNPAYVYLKGSAILQINEQIIDLNEMNHYFVLPSSCIKDLKIKRIDARQVMTVENLTSFHDISLKDTFFIFTNGFHNHVIEAFLKCLYDFLGERVSYLHFGDIDAGGFHIYESLIKKTQIPFQTYKMNVNMLKKYKAYTKPLTENDRKRLLSVKDRHQEVIDYMLKYNVKLEQEIIGEEDERKNTYTY
ncbi:hypothetical protein DWZ66_03495 [Coprobacillus sp. AF34-1BH]|nr:hypothetical protein DWX19_10990 [Coprobacillus sp. AF18-40]RGT85220.1 hypothetical protein DWX05_08285 [Coprobacillus sp. AF18-15LB]RHB02520.1 hypothetical protein DW906_09210 [Coprobacillus sp. AM42-12AC]RHH08870.1 hypothetical protein DW226_08995 [Coprobacillus sp. AM18-4LB-d2]RHP26375.1 hypothetical protein DWZ66_03495 [Coprobacillus sp. AF34-1BH]RHQ86477.1 hypothetical protein DWX89_05275 [Coprobacillus sp. AF21-8LB]